MISVLLYGRNDTHGYNLHRRAALSLNCLAEVLTDPADEILFVDYNTPDELPTLVEALADTLTERCLGLLRVIRVPAALHEQRFAARTHLPALEPVARNAAARRSNPANRWLLSTNTDMVLLPRSDRSLTEICGDLPDGFYGLPRFELPEWLWEILPRTAPERAMAEIRHLGLALRLNEPSLSHDWIRFDAPGDFQLILRKDFFEIDGFDEEMLLGWHVDSNLSRRIFVQRGSVESLEDHIVAYHCNHNRTPTVHHGETWIENDLGRFVFNITHPELPAQRESWGLAGTSLDEVPVGLRRSSFAQAVVAAIPAEPAPSAVDTRETKFSMTYDSGHVLPFVADSLIVSSPGAIVGYVGANPVLEQMLATLIAGFAGGLQLSVAELDDPHSVDRLADTVHVFVVDLGVDESLLENDRSGSRSADAAELRTRLRLVFDALHRLVDLERARLARGEHARRFVLVNSGAAFWNSYVLAQLDSSQATWHSRVRRATVKHTPRADASAKAADLRALRLVHWSQRSDSGATRLQIGHGQTIAIAALEDYAGFGEGWAYPDVNAVWTQGLRSDLRLVLDPVRGDDIELTLAFDKIGVVDQSVNVRLALNGAEIASREFTRGGELVWHVPLDREALTDGEADVTLEIEGPVTWSDFRQFGLHLTAISVRRGGWRGRLDAFRNARARGWRRISPRAVVHD